MKISRKKIKLTKKTLFLYKKAKGPHNPETYTLDPSTVFSIPTFS